ncbi:hypothetical protein DL770_009770 [Monosporascus sp. CRB-9-2]|nr:hypothetical protein DL770_009770 [Monosporascus sp. CRB-9-2]
MQGRFHRVVETNHQKYGDVFRVSPNELSFCTVSAYKTIYATRTSAELKIPKDKFYDMFGAGFSEPCISCEKDPTRAGAKRSMFAGAFSAKSLCEQEVVLQRCINAFVTKVGKIGSCSEGVDMRKWYEMISFDILGEMAFGESFNCIENGHVFAISVMDNLNRYPLLMAAIKSLPKKWTTSKSSQQQSDFSREKVKRRLEKRSEQRDFLSNVSKKVLSGEVSQEEMAAHSSTFVIAGGETTATSMTAITYYLLKSPSSHEKLKQEIRSRFNSVEEIDITKSGQMPFLQAIIKEGMRILPANSQGLPRRSPGIEVDGHFVPEGTEFHVSPWTMAHDPRYWNEPYVFAYAQMSLELAKLIYAYDMELVDKGLDYEAGCRMHFMWWKPEMRLWRFYHSHSGRFYRAIEKQHQKYGSVFRVSPNELSFASVQSWKDIYGHATGAERRTLVKSEFYELYGAGFRSFCIGSERDPRKHAEMRKSLSAAFSTKSLKDQEGIVNGVIDRFVERLGTTDGAAVTGLNITKWFEMVSFDVLGEMAFGESFGSIESGHTHFWSDLVVEHLYFITLADNLHRLPILPTLARILFPKLLVVRNKNSQYARAQVAKRLERESPRKDFLMALVNELHRGKIGLEELTAHSSTLVIAGGETTATALAATTFYLLQNRHCYEKLQHEIRSRFGSYDDIDSTVAQQLPYLQAVISEGLRMYAPGSQGFPRLSPGAFVDGHYIPKGTELYTSAWTVTHDPKNFHEPMAFKPERWLDSECSVVRTAPNELSFNSAQSWKDIYGFRQGHQAFIKSEFYDGGSFASRGMHSIVSERDPEVHGHMRRYISHAFSDRSLSEQEPLIAKTIDKFILRVGRKGASEKGFDIGKSFEMMTFDIIGDLAFGETFGGMESGALTQGALADVLKRFPTFASVLMVVMGNKIRKLMEDTRTNEGYAIDLINRRINRKSTRKDFMTRILEQRDPAEVTDLQLAAHASDFVLAGSETTATCLSCIVFYLLSDGEILAKLTREIRSHFSQYSDINGLSTQSLPYLRAVILEALRIYPPLPVSLPRVVPEGGDTVDGHHIPEGTIVSTNPTAAGLDPANFERPLEFRPERWQGKNDTDNLDAAQPFSLGPRGCIGRHLGWMELRTTLSKLFWVYDLELVDRELDWLRDSEMHTLWRKPKLFGATVHILDINQPVAEELPSTLTGLHFHQCDVSSWVALRGVFETVGRVDFAFANAGVSEETDYFADTFDAEGKLEEAAYRVLDVNLSGVLNLVKLAWSTMRKHKVEGSIVITTSATAYAPEQSLPVYAGGKLALVGLIRALRSVIIRDNITINGVAPAATVTRLLPVHLATPIVQQGLPVSDADFVGLALVYSATAQQDRMVEPYGKETEQGIWRSGRWNGRVILTLGKEYTEMEEPLADLRPFWFGRDNLRLTRQQQAATDFRA